MTKIHELFSTVEKIEEDKRLMKLVPCEPYKSGKKSRRVRKNRWVPANG